MMSGRLRVSLLIAVAVVLGAAAFVAKYVLFDDSEWFGSHDTTVTPTTPPTTLTAGRPECPTAWAGTKIPVIRPTSRHGASLVVGTMNVPDAGLVVSGPITDIPEFHDCQKFIREGGVEYDSLFAVFAASRLDSIMTDLAFDEVIWTSSAPGVASVSSAGVVTAHTAGISDIKATSRDGVRSFTVKARVVLGSASAADTAITVMAGSPPLPDRRVGENVSLVPILGPPTATTHAAAEIYTFGEGYRPLGIGPNFSCLYVYFNTRHELVAKMVMYGKSNEGEDQCRERIDPNVPTGRPEMPLMVIRTAATTEGEFPAAARWDFDPVNQQYYVGLKCGEGWCEVGAPKNTRLLITSAALRTSSATPVEQLRVMRGKGWYDQQELSLYTGGRLVPAGLVGTVVPAPGIETYDFAQYKKEFTVVAHVGLAVIPGATRATEALKYYKEKFNFDPAATDINLNRLNTISLCFGTRRRCKVPKPPVSIKCGNGADRFYSRHLWVKITPANGGNPLYRCGIRRDHTNVPGYDPSMIAATTRWRWLANDETVWDYCAAAGCCETDGTGIGWM